MTQTLPPTVLTMGEPGGIGGEITLKAWHSARDLVQSFFVIDSPARLQKLSDCLKLGINVVEISSPDETFSKFDIALPVLPIKLADQVVPGELNSKNAAAVILSIEQAAKFVQSGEACAIITNPIHKNALYKTGFSHPGHTEFLASLAGVKSEPVMMLASERLRVIPVTRHVSIQEALKLLTSELIIETAIIAEATLRQDFGIIKPRLAIAALNPHAGEGGTMGTEEKTLIESAIKELQSQGILVTGPHPPDTMFHEQARKAYDVALCMYHDQALIPIKTLDFDSAVNVTLGLPFIRTSPDHGTALDIAGTGEANEQSLVAALKLAGEMAQNRITNILT